MSQKPVKIDDLLSAKTLIHAIPQIGSEDVRSLSYS